MEQDNKPSSQGVAAYVERMHELALLTKNPMYVWLALQRILEEKAGSFAKYPRGVSSVIPDWIADYLLRTSERLNDLSCGLDYRIDPPPLDLSKYVDGMTHEELSSLQSPQPHRKLTPADAMKVVPSALGLTRDGRWNAFASLMATVAKAQEFHAYRDMREAGIPSKAALGAIMDANGVTDQSHMHDRIREGEIFAVRPQLETRDD